MKLKNKTLIGFLSLLLIAFVVWEFFRPMTPKNYKLDIIILSEIKNVEKFKDIETAVEYLKSNLKIKAVEPIDFDSDRVLIINSNDGINDSDFIAICNINQSFLDSNGALVLYKDGEIKRVNNWIDLIYGKEDLVFYEIILD